MEILYGGVDSHPYKIYFQLTSGVLKMTEPSM